MTVSRLCTPFLVSVPLVITAVVPTTAGLMAALFINTPKLRFTRRVHARTSDRRPQKPGLLITCSTRRMNDNTLRLSIPSIGTLVRLRVWSILCTTDPRRTTCPSWGPYTRQSRSGQMAKILTLVTIYETVARRSFFTRFRTTLRSVETVSLATSAISSFQPSSSSCQTEDPIGSIAATRWSPAWIAFLTPI